MNDGDMVAASEQEREAFEKWQEWHYAGDDYSRDCKAAWQGWLARAAWEKSEPKAGATMSTESMRRGAREANEESDRMAQSRQLGEAVGNMAAFVVAINRLTDRIERLEQQVADLKREQP